MIKKMIKKRDKIINSDIDKELKDLQFSAPRTLIISNARLDSVGPHKI